MRPKDSLNISLHCNNKKSVTTALLFYFAYRDPELVQYIEHTIWCLGFFVVVLNRLCCCLLSRAGSQFKLFRILKFSLEICLWFKLSLFKSQYSR